MTYDFIPFKIEVDGENMSIPGQDRAYVAVRTTSNYGVDSSEWEN